MGQSGPSRVDILGPDALAEVVSVLSESFFDYPVMRFVLGSDADYASRLEQLVTFFVMARVLREEVLLGVDSPGGLRAAALVSNPSGPSSPPELAVIREETWAKLGAGARSRYELFGAATAQFSAEANHIHLNMIGARRSAQGQGLGRAVLDAVHELSVVDASSEGVSLSTEVQSNVPLYEHFGYQIIGSARVGSAFRTWVMYRPNQHP